MTTSKAIKQNKIAWTNSCIDERSCGIKKIKSVTTLIKLLKIFTKMTGKLEQRTNYKGIKTTYVIVSTRTKQALRRMSRS